ncbi:hypothetical protein D3C78_1582430 [compost metagenome]
MQVLQRGELWRSGRQGGEARVVGVEGADAGLVGLQQGSRIARHAFLQLASQLDWWGQFVDPRGAQVLPEHDQGDRQNGQQPRRPEDQQDEPQGKPVAPAQPHSDGAGGHREERPEDYPDQ